MNDNDVRDKLIEAYSDLELTDPVNSILRRGTRLRRARRASRAASVAVAAVTVTAIGPSLTTTEGGRDSIRLVAYSLPSLPVSLDPVPDGLAVSFDYDNGRLVAHYTDGADEADRMQAELSLRVLDRAEDPEGARESKVSVQGQPGRLYVRDLPGTADDQSTVVWQNQLGEWVSLTGRGRFAAERDALAQAENVTNHPLPLEMRLDVAPAGWDLVGYKVIGPAGAVLALSDDEAPETDARRLTVALYTQPYKGLEPRQMEDPGPVHPVDVDGRSGELMEGTRGWFLQVPLDEGSYITIQAPRHLSRDQVVQMATGVSRR